MVAKGLAHCAKWPAWDDPRCIIAAGTTREGRGGTFRKPGVKNSVLRRQELLTGIHGASTKQGP